MIEWKVCTFQQLTLDELYAVLALRQQVFVLEQQCLYVDLDHKDQDAWHVQGFKISGEKRTLVAYARILKWHEGNDLSFGRVVTSPQVRNEGVGRALVTYVLTTMHEKFPHQEIAISAQCYLQKFYQSFGFKKISEAYDEDGILHIDMRLSKTESQTS